MCAVPTAPTLSTLTQEAMELAGYSSVSEEPAATIVGLMRTKWSETMKHELVSSIPGGKLKSLFTQGAVVTAQGKSIYDVPSDIAFYGDYGLQIVNGSTTGTATGGTSSTIIVESGHGTLGQWILVTSGAGVNEYRQITDISGTTLTVSPDFGTAPVNNDTYMLIDNFNQLEKRDIILSAMETDQDVRSKPKIFYPYETAILGSLKLKPTPDGVYGVIFNYFFNLQTLDLAGNLMVNLYNKWRSWWISGWLWRAWSYDNDDRAEVQKKLYYERDLPTLMTQEVLGSD